MQLSERWRERQESQEGVTLIELVITVAIMGIIVTSLVGVVLSYLQTNVDTSSRLTESHDVQFASAYWQRDVASIGIRDTTYDNSPSVHSFALLQSVAVGGNAGLAPGCAMPPGSVTIVTLGWSEYPDPAQTDTSTTITVAYATRASGARSELVRVRCAGSTRTSVTTIADNLDATPTVTCSTACNGTAGTPVPALVKMGISSSDPDGHGGQSYTATLTGERRQS